jgi:signal transduction histidine kinase
MGTGPAASGSGEVWAPAENAAHRRHEVQFYLDDRFLVRSLAQSVESALEAGSSAIVVVTKPHREGLAEELERLGIDFPSVAKQGRYLALDAGETVDQFTVNGVLDETRFQELAGELISCAATASWNESKVLVFGEMVNLLWQRGEAQEALRLEQFWNRLSESHSFRLRCAYPIATFDRDTHTELFSRICSEHHTVIPAEQYDDTDENDRLRTVARLQQTEQVLKTETAQRRIAQSQASEIQSQNHQLLSEIRKRDAVEEELRRFARRLLTARDQEQRRIAAELHENTAQLLAALSLYFGVLHEEKASLNPRVASVVASSRSVSDNLLNEIRKLSHLLHPPTLEDMGLASALIEYVDQFIASTGAKVELDIGKNLGRFDRNLEISVFRIVEEALAGVCSAADSCAATVRLIRTPTALTIEIQTHQAGVGTEGGTRAETRIMGVHERVMEYGGTVEFRSDPAGPVIAVTLPLEGHPAASEQPPAL